MRRDRAVRAISRGIVATAAATLAATVCLRGQSAGVVSLGDRREIFVDRQVIDTLLGAELRLHHPRREGPALAFDRPWEGPFSAYVTVLNDSAMFRMYYRGSPGNNIPSVTCYAESRDGVTWTKPELGIHGVMGTRANNVILADNPPFSENFSPFIDTRPGVPPEERYKAVAGNETTGLVAFVSADGLHWKKLRSAPVFTQGMFDSQNVVFWSGSYQRYFCYFRTWTGEGYTGFRTISRTVSADFLNWGDPVEMQFGDTPREHLYTNATAPYFRAPHIFLALAKRFFPDRAALPPARAEALVENPRYRVASSDAVLMSTRGGDTYDRTFMEAFFRPGPGERDWVARDNTPALALVPGGEREMYLYRMSHYAQPTAHLSRYSLRTDGFVSVHAPYGGGEMLTRPLSFSGAALEINVETSAAGGVRVEIQDERGEPFPGFTVSDCGEIFGDDIGRVVVWKGGSDVAGLAGRPVRVRFVMRDADLYSFRFR